MAERRMCFMGRGKRRAPRLSSGKPATVGIGQHDCDRRLLSGVKLETGLCSSSMPSSSAVVIFPFIAALCYTFSALLLKRSSELGVGLWRSTFVANNIAALVFSLLWLLGGKPVDTNPLWQPGAIALCLFG